MPRKPIVGGNWKCNPDSISKLDGLLENINKCDTSKCEVYVCPSPLHVTYCTDKLTNGAAVCPQNCNFKGCGAFTGEMAVEQMKDLGIGWCLIGHSERREYFKEDDELLATKLKYILDAGMKCVFCIGEKLPEREKGMEATMAVCISQLEQIKTMLDPEKVVIAYEPVWAIGTGVTATPEQAQETHAEIRKWIATNVSEECAASIRIQYGGSANAKNAPDLSAQVLLLSDSQCLSTTDGDACSCASMFPAGSRAAVQGLKSSTEYNGARCDVLGYQESSGRFATRLVHPSFSGKELLLREANLEFIHALLAENLSAAQAVLAARDGPVAFEDVGDRWGPEVGRAFVARKAFEADQKIFDEAPFLIVSNPRGLEKWIRRWDTIYEAMRRATVGPEGGRREAKRLLEAFEASDAGGSDVVESLRSDAAAVVETLWDAGAVPAETRNILRQNGTFEREGTKIATVLARWQTNQHELGTERRALYWLAPKVAHSCEPNVGWEDPDETGHVELRALRKVVEGEVLGVNYMDEAFLHLPLAQRRKRLLKERKFLCACGRCRREAREDSPTLQKSSNGVGAHVPPAVEVLESAAVVEHGVDLHDMD